MRQTSIIIVFVFVLFLAEFFLFNLFGRYFMPNLLLLLIIFMNLYAGIRYSLLTAFWAGALKDCFSIQPFGFYIFSFVVAAYTTTFLKNWVYHMGSPFSRLILIFLVVMISLSATYITYIIFHDAHLVEVLKYIFLPQIALTLLVANFVFQIFKICVSKLSV